MALASLVGAPTAACVPPGQCVFPEDWVPAKLVERQQVNHDTMLVTYGLADEAKALGLSTCACILAMFKEEGAPDPIVRPYTPVSTNAMIGKFQLCVKVYPGGKMGTYMANMAIGSELNFKHIPFNVKIQYPFNKENITMLVGGTGITPMIQALHAILGTAGDATKVTMLYGSKTQKDILCLDLLSKWEADFSDRLKVIHVLSEEPDESWTGKKGFITQDLLKESISPPGENTMVFVCGPPPMYAALCGPRDQPKEVTGALADLGYSADMVFKF
jgi:cytochrome-b5 reductase